MEPHLARLLKSNDPPSDRAFGEVKEILNAPLTELGDIDSETVSLRARLKFLEGKRHEIQKSVDEYLPILSPIRRLPNDILHEIFYHCLPTHRNSVISSSEAPVLLTHVSSKWRTVALSSPRLWCQLHITFSDSYQRSGSMQRQEHAFVVLSRRCEIVRKWLERSRSCLLSISIYYVDSPPPSLALGMAIPRTGKDNLNRELFRLLLSCCERWRALELVMPIEIYHQLDTMISPNTLRSLTALKLSFSKQPDRSLLPVEPFLKPAPIALLNAPQVRKVSLGGYSVCARWLSNTVPFAMFGQQLTYFCSAAPLGFTESLLLFRECGNLVHCKICITKKTEPLGTPINSVVTLPHLLAFSIVEGHTDLYISTRFYSSIDAPRLKWIDYRRQLFKPPDLDSDDQPVIILLRKSTELQKLTIEPRAFKPIALCQALEIVSPGLKHLVLGQEPLKPLLRGEINTWIVPRVFNLEWLLVDTDFRLGNSSPSIILPRLEIFEWSSGLVPDRTVLQFIIGRIKPVSALGMVALKRVRIMFDRSQEVDVSGEVRRYRKESMELNGVQDGDIELELKYPGPSLHPTRKD